MRLQILHNHRFQFVCDTSFAEMLLVTDLVKITAHLAHQRFRRFHVKAIVDGDGATH